jgi:hypothetical protein
MQQNLYIEFPSGIISGRKDLKMVGDAGFNPATSTVRKRHKKTKKRKK